MKEEIIYSDELRKEIIEILKYHDGNKLTIHEWRNTIDFVIYPILKTAIKKVREDERDKVMLFLSNLKEDTSAVYALYLLQKLKDDK